MKTINAAKRNLKKAKDALEDAILDKMAEVATKKGLTKMVFYFYSTYYKGDEVVECPAIDKIEQIYLDEINDHGFIAQWTKEKGWS
jgi:hypothetical protein